MKVYSIFDDMLAVISVENGYSVKGYLKGSRGIGEYSPVDGISPSDALNFKVCINWSAWLNETLRIASM